MTEKLSDQWRTPETLFQEISAEHGPFDIDTKCSTAAKYYVSSDGQVYNKFSGKFLRPIKNNNGYLYVNLGRNHRVYVHRLVAILYIPNIHNKPHVNHIDSNPLNNNVTNLEWCTHKENMQHAWDKGRFYKNKGENNKISKLTYVLAEEIRSKYIPYKYPQQKLADEYGVSRAAIQQVVEGRSWVK